MAPGTKTRSRLLALLVPGLLVLGYLWSAASADPPATGFNDADVMFLQMASHHEGQGVTVVRLARGREVRPELRTLVSAIESTQLDEVETMVARLRGWRRPLVPPPGSHAAHGGLPETAEEGLASTAAAPDARFEREFLLLLVAHQDDAVQIARRELAQGADPVSRALADRIVRSRTAQLTALRGHLL
ncbi:DUF305 domain-containing protein [Actinocorallia lasiicapitis]